MDGKIFSNGRLSSGNLLEKHDFNSGLCNPICKVLTHFMHDMYTEVVRRSARMGMGGCDTLYIVYDDNTHSH